MQQAIITYVITPLKNELGVFEDLIMNLIVQCNSQADAARRVEWAASQRENEERARAAELANLPLQDELEERALMAKSLYEMALKMTGEGTLTTTNAKELLDAANQKVELGATRTREPATPPVLPPIDLTTDVALTTTLIEEVPVAPSDDIPDAQDLDWDVESAIADTVCAREVVRGFLGTGPDCDAPPDAPSDAGEGSESGDETLHERQQTLAKKQRVTALRQGCVQPTTKELIDDFFFFSDVTGVIRDAEGFSIAGSTHVLLNRGKYKWVGGQEGGRPIRK